MTLVSLTFDRFVGTKQTRLKINTGIHVHARYKHTFRLLQKYLSGPRIYLRVIPIQEANKIVGGSTPC